MNPACGADFGGLMAGGESEQPFASLHERQTEAPPGVDHSEHVGNPYFLPHAMFLLSVECFLGKGNAPKAPLRRYGAVRLPRRVSATTFTRDEVNVTDKSKRANKKCSFRHLHPFSHPGEQSLRPL